MQNANKHIAKVDNNSKIRTLNDLLLYLISFTPFRLRTIMVADAYLHYSNQILFFISRLKSAALVITDLFFAVSTRTAAMPVLSLVHFLRNRSDDEVEIFDGFIDRYCGVPP